MRKRFYFVGFGIILLMAIITIPYLVNNKNRNYEYANHPAELMGTFVLIKNENSKEKYYILVDKENKTRVMKMYLDDAIIQNIENEEIPLSEIHTGDTIKVNFLGDIVASYPEIITRIQSVTLFEKNSDADIDALIELVPNP